MPLVDRPYSGSGYQPPSQAPFRCGHCEYFEAPMRCTKPEVIGDPKVKGHVEASGCCDFYRKGEAGNLLTLARGQECRA
jgi:hypothetical protein